MIWWDDNLILNDFHLQLVSGLVRKGIDSARPNWNRSTLVNFYETIVFNLQPFSRICNRKHSDPNKIELFAATFKFFFIANWNCLCLATESSLYEYDLSSDRWNYFIEKLSIWNYDCKKETGEAERVEQWKCSQFVYTISLKVSIHFGAWISN